MKGFKTLIRPTGTFPRGKVEEWVGLQLYSFGALCQANNSVSYSYV
jgi:hypothetical protein